MKFNLRKHGRLCTVTAIGALALMAFCTKVQAQPYSIDWHKVSGGGGTSTGGVYSVSGTIGQHDAGGPMIGGAYFRHRRLLGALCRADAWRTGAYHNVFRRHHGCGLLAALRHRLDAANQH